MFNISLYFGNNVVNRQKIFMFVKREYGFEKKKVKHCFQSSRDDMLSRFNSKFIRKL